MKRFVSSLEDGEKGRINCPKEKEVFNEAKAKLGERVKLEQQPRSGNVRRLMLLVTTLISIALAGCMAEWNDEEESGKKDAGLEDIRSPEDIAKIIEDVLAKVDSTLVEDLEERDLAEPTDPGIDPGDELDTRPGMDKKGDTPRDQVGVTDDLDGAVGDDLQDGPKDTPEDMQQAYLDGRVEVEYDSNTEILGNDLVREDQILTDKPRSDLIPEDTQEKDLRPPSDFTRTDLSIPDWQIPDWIEYVDIPHPDWQRPDRVIHRDRLVPDQGYDFAVDLPQDFARLDWLYQDWVLQDWILQDRSPQDFTPDIQVHLDWIITPPDLREVDTTTDGQPDTFGGEIYDQNWDFEVHIADTGLDHRELGLDMYSDPGPEVAQDPGLEVREDLEPPQEDLEQDTTEPGVDLPDLRPPDLRPNPCSIDELEWVDYCTCLNTHNMGNFESAMGVYIYTETRILVTTSDCDGLDNDCDGIKDEGCPAEEEICGDEVDNDGDGTADRGNCVVCSTDIPRECNIGDPGICSPGIQECASTMIWQVECYGGIVRDPAGENPEAGNCNDSLDNDCDGDTDCEDEGCADDPTCQ